MQRWLQYTYGATLPEYLGRVLRLKSFQVDSYPPQTSNVKKAPFRTKPLT